MEILFEERILLRSIEVGLLSEEITKQLAKHCLAFKTVTIYSTITANFDPINLILLIKNGAYATTNKGFYLPSEDHQRILEDFRGTAVNAYANGGATYGNAGHLKALAIRHVISEADAWNTGKAQAFADRFDLSAAINQLLAK